MFTKFKGIFSSKQSSGEANEYFGSRNEKNVLIINWSSPSVVDSIVSSPHPQNHIHLDPQNVILIWKYGLCRCHQGKD